MSERTGPSPEAGAHPAAGGPAADPALADLASLAARVLDAAGAPRDGMTAEDGDSLLAALRSGWRAWLAAGGGEGALLRSVLGAVDGWTHGALSSGEFEAEITRLWAVRLDELAGDAGTGEAR